MSNASNEQLTTRVYVEFLKAFGPFLLPLGFIAGVTVGVTEERFASALGLGAAHILVFFLLLPWLIVNKHMKGFNAQKGDVAGARLQRLLALPRRVELDAGGSVLVGSISYVLVGGYLWGWPMLMALLVGLVAASLAMLAGVRFWLATEKLMRAESIAEFHRDPTVTTTPWWGHWPRMQWYLPFAFLSILVGTASILGGYIYARLRPALDLVQQELLAAGHLAASEIVAAHAATLGAQLAVPMIALCLFMLFFSWLTATNLAKRYGDASREVQSAVEAFAQGTPRLPDWIGTDEFGDLAQGLSGVFGRLTAHAETLRSSASELIDAALKLAASTTQQHQMMSRHAAALRETEVTAQEIQQTSQVASEKTANVLKTSEHAAELGRTGGTAIEQSLAGLSGIRDEVSEMSDQISQLGERARQIVGITGTVKELADQSNMLALNAAIEAVRSGEHGKGFGVVAREIRTLADQSIQATSQVRAILEDITDAIQRTVALSERGSSRVQKSLEQVESSGTSLREVSSIVSENAASARVIAGAVSQQGAGISQIFLAVRDLAALMDMTVEQLKQTDDTLVVVRRVAERVDQAVKGFGGGGASPDSEPKKAAA